MLLHGLEALSEIALDMRWSRNHEADTFWERADRDLWEATGNPWLIVQSVSVARLVVLSRDAAFMQELRNLHESARPKYLQADTWFISSQGSSALKLVAYFSMEFGPSEAPDLCRRALRILAGSLRTRAEWRLTFAITRGISQSGPSSC
jgi:glycogen phosphorylase